MTVVRVVVERSGGFAGLTRTAEVDDPEEARALAAEVRRAGLPAGRSVPDGFVYSVTVVSRTTRRTVELPASALHDELLGRLRALVG